MATNLVLHVSQKALDHILCIFRVYIKRTETSYLSLDQRLQQIQQGMGDLSIKADTLNQRVQDLDRRLRQLEQRPVYGEKFIETKVLKVLSEKLVSEIHNDEVYPPEPRASIPRKKTDSNVVSEASINLSSDLSTSAEPFDADDMQILSEDFKRDFVWLRQNLIQLPRVNSGSVDKDLAELSKVFLIRKLVDLPIKLTSARRCHTDDQRPGNTAQQHSFPITEISMSLSTHVAPVATNTLSIGIYTSQFGFSFNLRILLLKHKKFDTCPNSAFLSWDASLRFAVLCAHLHSAV